MLINNVLVSIKHHHYMVKSGMYGLTRSYCVKRVLNYLQPLQNDKVENNLTIKQLKIIMLTGIIKDAGL